MSLAQSHTICARMGQVSESKALLAIAIILRVNMLLVGDSTKIVLETVALRGAVSTLENQ